MIRKAMESDLDILVKLARIVEQDLKINHIDQWSPTYPGKENFFSDIEKNGLFVYLSDGIIVGSISVLPENDPFYHEINFQGKHAYVVHRLMVNPAYMRQKIGKALFEYAISLAKAAGCDSVKVDTHPDNFRMQGLILSLGFHEIGYIQGMNRIGYELLIT